MGALLLAEHSVGATLTESAAAEVDKSATSLQLGAFIFVRKNKLARDLQTSMREIHGILAAISYTTGDYTSSSQKYMTNY